MFSLSTISLMMVSLSIAIPIDQDCHNTDKKFDEFCVKMASWENLGIMIALKNGWNNI
jgi:hypothetical protein